MLAWLSNKFGVTREFATHFLLPFGLILFLSAILGLAPVVVAALGLSSGLGDAIKVLGAFGDMFGLLNAIFSGVAFAAIYYTLRIHQKQYEVQLSEPNMKREMAALFVDEAASKHTFLTDVPGSTGDSCPARYARIVLRNRSRVAAKGCRLLLTSIESRVSGQPFSVIPESMVTLRLLQPVEGDGASEDAVWAIPHNLPCYFNVRSIKIDSQEGRPAPLLQVAHFHSNAD